MDYNFATSKQMMAQFFRRTKKCCVKVRQHLINANLYFLLSILFAINLNAH